MGSSSSTIEKVNKHSVVIDYREEAGLSGIQEKIKVISKGNGLKDLQVITGSLEDSMSFNEALMMKYVDAESKRSSPDYENWKSKSKVDSEGLI